jgi:hypothetical protein
MSKANLIQYCYLSYPNGMAPFVAFLKFKHDKQNIFLKISVLKIWKGEEGKQDI